MNDQLIQTAIKFLLRRGLTLLGTAGASVSDDWIAQTASILLMIGNEIYQARKAHQADKSKAEIVRFSR